MGSVKTPTRNTPPELKPPENDSSRREPVRYKVCVSHSGHFCHTVLGFVLENLFDKNIFDQLDIVLHLTLSGKAVPLLGGLSRDMAETLASRAMAAIKSEQTNCYCKSTLLFSATPSSPDSGSN